MQSASESMTMHAHQHIGKRQKECHTQLDMSSLACSV